MRVSVSTYSFIQLIREGSLSQLGCIAKAKEMGFDGIEIQQLYPHDGSTPKDYAKKLREESERVGLPIVCFTTDADFLKGSGGDMAKEVERVCQLAEIAALLGAPRMRHDATTGFGPDRWGEEDFTQALPVLAEACRDVTAAAESLGVETMVENHGFFCQDSHRVKRLVQQVQNPNFGLLADMGNFLCADQSPAEAVQAVAPYTRYVHAKDFHVKKQDVFPPGQGFFQSRGGNFLRGAIIGHGDVPVFSCLQALDRAGYQGFVGIEFEGLEPPLTAIAIGLENLRKMLDCLKK